MWQRPANCKNSRKATKMLIMKEGKVDMEATRKVMEMGTITDMGEAKGLNVNSSDLSKFF